MKAILRSIGLAWLAIASVAVLAIYAIADLVQYRPDATMFDSVTIVMVVCLFGPGVAALVISWRMDGSD